MEVETGPVTWDYGLQWLLLSCLAYAISYLACGLPLALAAESGNPGDEIGLFLVLLALIGGITGLAQFMVLRWRLINTANWIGATALGWTVGYLAAFGVNQTGSDTLWLVWLCVGSALGVLQWVVLRGKVMRAAWWILVNITSWPTSALLGERIHHTLSPSPLQVNSLAPIAGLIVTVVLAESARGLVAVWLLQHPTAQSSHTPEQSPQG